MEPCTQHPELTQLYDVQYNAYRFACTQCGQTLNIYYYAAISRTRKEWQKYIVDEVTSYFGAEWGQKALFWLLATEVRDNEPAKPDTTA